mmetsp:Transcript_6031/g.8282  ORF Transcript_6031/g.8282 Transcript_6031/m.8282 type:complete len:240 (+) Transcript_6031:385-1104(+)
MWKETGGKENLPRLRHHFILSNKESIAESSQVSESEGFKPSSISGSICPVGILSSIFGSVLEDLDGSLNLRDFVLSFFVFVFPFFDLSRGSIFEGNDAILPDNDVICCGIAAILFIITSNALLILSCETSTVPDQSSPNKITTLVEAATVATYPIVSEHLFRGFRTVLITRKGRRKANLEARRGDSTMALIGISNCIRGEFRCWTFLSARRLRFQETGIPEGGRFSPFLITTAATWGSI